MKVILITGGAGYIGSLVSKKLLDKGHKVVVMDNLSTGFKEGIDPRSTFREGDIRDINFVKSVFTEFEFTDVLDFAAKLDVSESFDEPEEYFDVNVFGLSNILKCIKNTKVENFIFSSTAAVHGLLDKKGELIIEDDITNPSNPYGDSKLAGERLTQFAAQKNDFNYVIFRYFNVIGGKKPGAPVEYFTTILPKIISSIKNGTTLTINGDDYNTIDGTCIRDYIHVEDLANAHVLAIENMSLEKSGIFNLSVGQGTSILQLIKSVEKVVKCSVKYEVGPRRYGDPVVSAASNNKFLSTYNWQIKYDDVDKMVQSACLEYIDLDE